MVRDGWLYVSTPRFTVALIVRDGVVTETPPYARKWALGKTPAAIAAMYPTEEFTVSETVKKPYAFVIGQVQAFTKDGVKQPACKVGDANGQSVYNFTIKTALGNLVDIALWSEYAHVAPSIGESYIMFVDGPVSQREYNGKVYTKVDAKRLAVIPAVVPQEREVVNQVGAPASAVAAVIAAAAAPVAAAPAEVAVAAPAAAVFNF